MLHFRRLQNVFLQFVLNTETYLKECDSPPRCSLPPGGGHACPSYETTCHDPDGRATGKQRPVPRARQAHVAKSGCTPRTGAGISSEGETQEWKLRRTCWKKPPGSPGPGAGGPSLSAGKATSKEVEFQRTENEAALGRSEARTSVGGMFWNKCGGSRVHLDMPVTQAYMGGISQGPWVHVHLLAWCHLVL